MCFLCFSPSGVVFTSLLGCADFTSLLGFTLLFFKTWMLVNTMMLMGDERGFETMDRKSLCFIFHVSIFRHTRGSNLPSIVEGNVAFDGILNGKWTKWNFWNEMQTSYTKMKRWTKNDINSKKLKKSNLGDGLNLNLWSVSPCKFER